MSSSVGGVEAFDERPLDVRCDRPFAAFDRVAEHRLGRPAAGGPCRATATPGPGKTNTSRSRWRESARPAAVPRWSSPAMNASSCVDDLGATATGDRQAVVVVAAPQGGGRTDVAERWGAIGQHRAIRDRQVAAGAVAAGRDRQQDVAGRASSVSRMRRFGRSLADDHVGVGPRPAERADAGVARRRRRRPRLRALVGMTNGVSPARCAG